MKKALGILMGLIVITGSFTSALMMAGASEDSKPEPLAPYAAFRIDSNAGFAAHASSGNGGNTNPWIIENKEINATGLGYGIYIGNTTDHFIVRNCTVWSASGVGSVPFYPDAGMVIYNVTKGNVDNCTFYFNQGSGLFASTNNRNISVNGATLFANRDGFETWDTRNSRFSNLSCSNNGRFGAVFRESQNINLTSSSFTLNNEGVHLYYCNGFSMSGNNANENDYAGITLNASNNNDVFDNTARLNGGNGVNVTHNETSGSGTNLIYGNDINNNTQAGIAITGAAGLIVDTQLNTVENNNVSDNSQGISLSFANNNTIIDNWIHGNTVGCAMAGSLNNTAHHNDFMGNANQAYDDGQNAWNDAYPSGGNYWDDYSGVDVMSGALQDQPGSDGFGDVQYTIDSDSADLYPIWFPADIDTIQIVDGPNGTGNAASAHEYASPWFNITLWAAAFNDTLGYLRDVWVNWTNVNYSGAQSSIDNTTGYSTSWMAGPSLGSALLTSEYFGMTRDVNVTIATYQPDLMIDGKSDNVYENPPTTQISWRNFTQSGSAPFSLAAQNDGATAGSFTLVWDISGLPGTFYAVMVNADLGANVTSSMGTGLGFNLNPGEVMNFTLLINSSTNAGFGQTGTVNIGLFPPSGTQDSVGAIAQVCEPDYVVLTDLPDGAALTSVDLQIGHSVTAFASAYNNTGPSYLGLIPLDWTDSPDLGTFTNASGTSSTFTAVNSGTATITGSSTGLGLDDSFTVVVAPPADQIAPESQVNVTYPYWQKVSPMTIHCIASDDASGVAEVSLWFRYSPDNATWGSWTYFTTDSASPWLFQFTFGNESGYYDFYSIAEDNDGNVETAPGSADLAIGFDDVLPAITAAISGEAGTGETLTITAFLYDDPLETRPITASVTDNMALDNVYAIYRIGNGNETNVTMTGNATARTCSITIPTDSLDLLYVRLAAVDLATNWNSSNTIAITVLDNIQPTASAGADFDCVAGTPVGFDATGSTDNIGIVNYTWTFQCNGTAVSLWGAEPNYTFWTAGVYEVTLTVADAIGLIDQDTAQVTVAEAEGADDDGEIPGVCWIVGIILVVVGLVIILLMLKRRKKPEQVPEILFVPAQDPVIAPAEPEEPGV